MKAGGRVKGGPQVGKVARWLHNPYRLGGPHRFRAGGGAQSEVAHKWARWLHNPCRLGGPRRFKAGGQNQRWPASGQGGYMTPVALGGPRRFTAEQREQSKVARKWARWLHNPCRMGVPTASERGARSEVAHKWARWLHDPCRVGGPHRYKAGGRITGGPQVGKEAT